VLGCLVQEPIFTREVVDKAAHKVGCENERKLVLVQDRQNLFKDLKSPVLAFMG
jgi:hypothetical protein